MSLDTARFIIDQAEKKLQGTIDTSRLITDRSVNIMQLSIPLSIALIGLILADANGPLVWFYLIILTLSMIISCICLHVYDSFDIITLGKKPGNFRKGERFISTFREKDRERIHSILEELDTAIETNAKRNRARQSTLFFALGILKLLVFCILGLSATGSLILLFQDQ